MTERVVGLAVVVMLAGGCGGSGEEQPARLRLVGGEPHRVALGIPHVPQGEPWVVRGLTLCVDGQGEAEVVAVRGVQSDIRVDDFALREWAADAGQLRIDHRGALTAAGFDPELTVASHRCGSGTGDELAVQLTNPHDGVGISRAFEVEYLTAGEARTLRIPFEVRLCPLASAARPACQPT